MYWTWPGRSGVGGRAFGGVERRDSSAGSGSNIDEPAAVAQASGHLVDDLGDLRNGLFDRSGDLRIFVVDDAGDFESGFGVKTLRCLVLALGSEVLQ